MRVTMVMWRARLRRRSPPRLMRCRMVFPEDAGIGLMPARLAKAASVLMRPRCDHAVSVTAAVTGPIPGCWRRVAAGLCWTRSVIRLVTSLSLLSSAVTCLASLIALSCAVWVARSLLCVLHAAIVTICVAVSGWRASMPRSTTRSSAVSALIVAATFGAHVVAGGQQHLGGSAEATVSLWFAQLRVLEWERRGGNALGVQRVGLADAVVRAGVHTRGLEDRVSSIRCGARQTCLMGVSALDCPKHTSIATGASCGPGRGA